MTAQKNCRLIVSALTDYILGTVQILLILQMVLNCLQGAKEHLTQVILQNIRIIIANAPVLIEMSQPDLNILRSFFQEFVRISAL